MPAGRPSAVKGVKLNYMCTWTGCIEVHADTFGLRNHVLSHFQQLIYSSTTDTEAFCDICSANLDLTNAEQMERHSHYHALIMILRAKGLSAQTKKKWPRCAVDSACCEMVPDLLTPFHCGWLDCGFITNDIIAFHSHVHAHADEYLEYRSQYPKKKTCCLWNNCTHSPGTARNIALHLRSHIQYKDVACHNCGFMFATFTKLEDHLKRQNMRQNGSENEHHQSPSSPTFKCDRCLRIFGSKRLLVNHMTFHVNKTKCPLCDMTLRNQSVLVRHMRYRHSDYKPFSCDLCSYACKDRDLLERHLTRIHGIKHSTSPSNGSNKGPEIDLDLLPAPSGEIIKGPLATAAEEAGTSSPKSMLPRDPLLSIPHPSTASLSRPQSKSDHQDHIYNCPVATCKFKSPYRYGFLVHLGKQHPELRLRPPQSSSLIADHEYAVLSDFADPNKPVYLCHLCHAIRRRGIDMSNHLIKLHKLARPPGHERFTYILSEDGFYRLQSTRLDSLEVASTILGQQTVDGLLAEAGSSLG